MDPFPEQHCERARRWASLRLDGELSELESRLLADHVRRCQPCAEHVDEMEWAAAALRATPLESFEVALALPRRRRVRARAVGAVAAAGAVVVLAIGAAFGVSGSRGDSEAPGVRDVSPRPAIADAIEMAAVKRAQLLSQTPQAWRGSRGHRLT